jgi:hypothetical protein
MIVEFLKLPDIPKDLVGKLTEASKKLPLSDSSYKWMTEYHENSVQVVYQTHKSLSSIGESGLQTQLEDLYFPYFKQDFTILLGIIKNSNNSGYASCPPHCDSVRMSAINYVVQSGGSNVITKFYKKVRQGSIFFDSENIKYGDAEVHSEIKIPEHKWHCFNPHIYHSVENVETSRILLSLFLDDNPFYSDFKHKYLNLIE